MHEIRFQPWLTSGPSARYRADVEAILSDTLTAVEPRQAVCRALRRQGDCLHLDGREYDLKEFERIFIVGAGKAAGAMALAVEQILDDCHVTGIVNVRRGTAHSTRRVALVEAAHPIPDEGSLRGAHEQIRLLREARASDLVIVVLSGGASALITSPAGKITLADLKTVTDLLLRSGATIHELNTVRKHLDGIKGGQLAALAAPATVIALILSDVVGNSLDTIASGPTVADPTTFAEACRVLKHRGLWNTVPGSVREHLTAGSRGEIPDTPKPSAPLFSAVHNIIIGSNAEAAEAARGSAISIGYQAEILTTFLEGEAREVGKLAAALAREMAEYGRPLKPPACLILGGETTVTVRGTGRGGRNQELALAAAIALQGAASVAVVAFATDGVDGSTEAAGALADGTTIARGGTAGLDGVAALACNDSHTFFHRLGDLLVTGPTGTNVNDFLLVFAFGQEA